MEEGKKNGGKLWKFIRIFLLYVVYWVGLSFISGVLIGEDAFIGYLRMFPVAMFVFFFWIEVVQRVKKAETPTSVLWPTFKLVMLMQVVFVIIETVNLNNTISLLELIYDTKLDFFERSQTILVGVLTGTNILIIPLNYLFLKRVVFKGKEDIS